MISSDGFRFGNQLKTSTPNIHLLINNGTEAETSLIPRFPFLHFPKSLSLTAVLWTLTEVIIFTQSGGLGSHCGRLADKGLKAAAAYFWAGSEVHKGTWDCPEDFFIDAENGPRSG